MISDEDTIKQEEPLKNKFIKKKRIIIQTYIKLNQI